MWNLQKGGGAQEHRRGEDHREHRWAGNTKWQQDIRGYNYRMKPNQKHKPWQLGGEKQNVVWVNFQQNLSQPPQENVFFSYETVFGWDSNQGYFKPHTQPTESNG